jgi:hypothetical protein
MIRDQRDDNWQLGDSEFALLDLCKALVEILIAAKIAEPQVIDTLVSSLDQKYVQKRMNSARIVLDLFRSFVNDPRRHAFREELHKLLSEPPTASA